MLGFFWVSANYLLQFWHALLSRFDAAVCRNSLGVVHHWLIWPSDGCWLQWGCLLSRLWQRLPRIKSRRLICIHFCQRLYEIQRKATPYKSSSTCTHLARNSSLCLQAPLLSLSRSRLSVCPPVCLVCLFVCLCIFWWNPNCCYNSLRCVCSCKHSLWNLVIEWGSHSSNHVWPTNMHAPPHT